MLIFLYEMNILKLLFFLFIVSVQAGNFKNRVLKIINGVEVLPQPPDCGTSFSNSSYDYNGSRFNVEKGQFPWIVALYKKNAQYVLQKKTLLYDKNYQNSVIDFKNFETFKKYDQYCSGSLISSNFVLTAAHCLYKNKLEYLRIGILNKQNPRYHMYGVHTEHKIHEKFYGNDKNYDIALIKIRWMDEETNSPIHFQPSNDANFICLPQSEKLNSNRFVHYTPFQAGWSRIIQKNGKPDDNPLLVATQVKILRRNCNFGRNILCTYSITDQKDVCSRDTGGPLMLPIIDARNSERWFQIGVAISAPVVCNHTHSPTQYLRVGKFINWIKSTIQNLDDTY